MTTPIHGCRRNLFTAVANFFRENRKQHYCLPFPPIDIFVTKIIKLFFDLLDIIIRTCVVNNLEKNLIFIKYFFLPTSSVFHLFPFQNARRLSYAAEASDISMVYDVYAGPQLSCYTHYTVPSIGLPTLCSTWLYCSKSSSDSIVTFRCHCLFKD